MGTIKYFDEFINETIWSDMEDRSIGDQVRREDEMQDDDFKILLETAKMFKHFVRVNPISYDTCKNFVNYITARKKEHFWNGVDDRSYDKIIKFVKDHWGDCKGINEFTTRYINLDESIWSDMEDRSLGDQVRDEDKIPEHIKEVLSRYIELFAWRVYYWGDYTVGSQPDFIAFVKDYANNIKIEELHPDIQDVIDCVKSHWDTIIDLCERAVQKVDKDEEILADNLWKELGKTNESIWSDMEDRSIGDQVRKEDDPLSVIWAKEDVEVNGVEYFSYEEALKLQHSGWRLPTLEEVAELDELYEKGLYKSDSEAFYFMTSNGVLTFEKKGLIYISASDKPIDKDFYYCWTSTLLESNNRFAHILTFDNDHPIHTPLNCTNINDTVTQDITNGKLCVRLVKSK